MDERSQNGWRDRFMRPFARRVKIWAEAILAPTFEPGEHSGADLHPSGDVAPRENGARSEERAPASAPGSASREPRRQGEPAEPPMQWLRDVQTMREGPPADWVERVRRGAPHLLTRVEGFPVPRPASVASPPVEPPRREGAEASGMGAPPRAEDRSRLPEVPPRASVASREPPSRPGVVAEPARSATPQEQARGGALPSPASAQGGTAAPLATPTPAPREPEAARAAGASVPPSEPREASSVAPSRSTGPAAVPLSEPRLVSPAPQVQEVGLFEPARQEISRPVPTPAAAATELRVWRPGSGYAASATPTEPSPEAYPWGSEPVTQRSEPRAWPLIEGLPAPSPHPWPVLPDESGWESWPSSRSSSESSETRAIAPWPELPEPPSADPADAAALLQQWERLSRLDREQRGE